MEIKPRYIHEIIDILLSDKNPYIIEGYIYPTGTRYKIIPSRKDGVPLYGRELSSFNTKEEALNYLKEMDSKNA